MFQPEFLQPSWPSFNNMNSFLDEDKGYVFDMDMIMPNLETIFSDDLIDFPAHVDDLDFILPKDDFSLDLKEFEATLSGEEIREMAGSLEESEKFSPSQQSLIQSLILPNDDMGIDHSLGIFHLITAYGEAMEKEQKELTKVIMERVCEKVSPMGETMDRLLHYLFQPLDKQKSDYLKQESIKNFNAAFKVFNQTFPYGKFAHFAANKAILEAMPHGVEIIHIIDFDIGEGIQWSSMLEAIECRQREIKLTSIKWAHEEDSNDDCSRWSFEETKKRLLDHSRYCGVKLKVEEMELQNLESEIKKIPRRGGRREWLAFNCMVGIPHMGRVRNTRHGIEFLKVAKELLLHTPNCDKGIIAFGDGDAWEMIKTSSSFRSFFEGYLLHYHALLESMEGSFPIHLGQARMALECLFVAPFVSSGLWVQKWKERDELCDFELNCGLEGWRVSNESLVEAKEMVREGVSPFAVMVEGENKNEMVLEWKGIPLVRVSLWRN